MTFAGAGAQGGERDGARAENARAARFFVPVSCCVWGCGFTLAFGWLWFPGLRDALLPGLTALFGQEGGFSLTVFGLALAAGFMLGGFFAPRLKPVPALLLTHGAALGLFVLAFLCRVAGTNAAGVLPEVLLGIGAALPGVWWTGHILSLGPVRAAAALAWAACAALLLALPLALFPSPLPPLFAVYSVAAGIALAATLALLTLRPSVRQDQGQDRGQGGEPGADSGGAIPLSPPLSAALSAFRAVGVANLHAPVALAALFFGLGSLNVLAPYGTGLASALAQACGAVLAAALLAAWAKRARNRAEPGQRERSPAGGWRVTLLAACALAVPALCLPLFPLAASPVLFICSGLLEAAALALAASVYMKTDTPGAPYPAAGSFLVLALALVNGGWLAGREILNLAGAFGPALPAFAAAGLLAAIAYREARQAAPIPRAIASNLTEKEHELALLLVQGHNNKAIAETLELTENTVRWHIKNLNKKIGARDRAGLIAALRGKALP